MQIDLSGHHVEVTEPLRNYVNEKIGRLEKHFDRVTDVHVILSVEKMAKKAEATIQVKGNKIFAQSDNQDMYAAIDSLADKLDRQILKHKEKLKGHRDRTKSSDSLNSSPDEEL